MNGIRDEILYQSERTRVLRRHLEDGAGSIICKEPLGADTAGRLRHELGILYRLAGIEGVPRLSSASIASAIVLEDAGGIPLAQTLRGDPLDVPALLALALELTRIAAAMHHLGVVHKDINPANILLVGPRRRPMLIDFDLATTFAEERPGFIHHHQIAGTLAYIAPEQTGRTGRPVDHRADLYALGATFHELATGRPPFAEGDALELIRDHLTRMPVPPAELAPHMPQRLSDLIMRLLEKEPDRRYQSADGLAHDLSRLSEALGRDGDMLFPLGERDFPLRLVPPSRLIGREEEIGAMRAAFDNVRHGQCRGVLVAGAPGIGKTALINELRPLVTARRGWFVAGKFDQYRHEAPSATVQALRALGQLLLAEPEAQLAQQRTCIQHAVGVNAGLIAALLPEFALLLGVQPKIAGNGDPASDEERLRQTLLDLLRAIASPERPVVMVLDDLQWAGSTSIRFIETVLMDEELRGLLLVGAYREAEVDAAHPLSAMLPRWERMDAALLLRLNNLPPRDLGTLLAEMLRLPPVQAAQLADAVGARTDGNPYDTVELVNALRHDGVLVPGGDGWSWDATTIRRFVGEGEVVDLLTERITRLPDNAQQLLDIMACLGGGVELGLLQAASGLSVDILEERLAPSLEDGLLVMVMEQGGPINAGSAVRFRHDRVQQAAYHRLAPAQRCALPLALARRLAALPDFHTAAAEQYLSAVEAVHDPEECRRVARLFHEMATQARRATNYAAVERFLAAALALMEPIETAQDTHLLIALETGRHAALYSLGRLDEADAVYCSIERRCGDPLERAEAACVQVSSLTNRGQMKSAVAFGMVLLRQLGLDVPEGDVGGEVARKLDTLYRWVDEASPAADLQRPEATDPYAIAAARLINRTIPAAYFCDQPAMAWLVIESVRLWAEYGPCAAMVGPVSHAGFVMVAWRQAYRTGYAAVRHLLTVSEARGYEPETSQARFLFAFTTSHWFEPLEDNVQQTQHAREGLLHGGDLQNACFTYTSAIPALLDCAPALDDYISEVESGLAFAERTRNDMCVQTFVVYRQLARALRGETSGPGSLTDDTFDEAAYLASPLINPIGIARFHVQRALAAALFADKIALARHAGEAMALLPYLRNFYVAAVVHLLQALALAQRAGAAAPDERAALLAELDVCRDWFAARAADAPVNFLHLLHWMEAERAWAAGDAWGAARAFDAALREAQPRRRPWHRALLTERAALFHLENGLEHTGRQLLTEARRLYDTWGASAKVRELERVYVFLPAVGRQQRKDGTFHNGDVSTDAIDLLAILRASQALGSETSVEGLKARVVELLGAITGATAVSVVLRHDELRQWRLSPATGEDATPIPVEEAGARGLLPLSAFHYALRTREPLLVDDATRDDRFAGDPYLAGLDCCSLLVVPILSQGVPRAMLLMENRLSGGVFSAERLDAVMLIAGQLAVSLDNALLETGILQSEKENTELQRYNAELKELNAKLSMAQAQLVQSEKLASIGQLAAGVAHEINNPIGFIFSNFNMLKDYLDSLFEVLAAYERAEQHIDAPDVVAAIQSVRQHADLDFLKEDIPGMMNETRDGIVRVRQIVQDLRDFSRVDSKQEWQWANLHQGIDSTLNIVASEIKYKADVIKEYGQIPDIECLPSQLNQVFMNLAVNAAHACGPERGKIIIRTGSEGEQVWIEVSDTGCGIPGENLQRIFDPFFTTKPVGQGTGLGLSLSYGIVQKHQGSIDVQSEAGKGTCFRIVLPIRQSTPGRYDSSIRAETMP